MPRTIMGDNLRKSLEQILRKDVDPSIRFDFMGYNDLNGEEYSPSWNENRPATGYQEIVLNKEMVITQKEILAIIKALEPYGYRISLGFGYIGIHS